MALSYVQSLGDGQTRDFDLTFDYLSKSHVGVQVNGVDVPFTWTGVYQLRTTTPPPAGSVVERRRTTPRDKRLVSFTDGSTLVATDMNTSTLQAFFLAQEAFDQGAATMAVTSDGQYSAQTRRITLVGNPIDPQDVVTRSWAETAMTSQLTLAIAAKDLAQSARTDAQAALHSASQERQAAQQARTDAQSARDSASGHRLIAQNADTSAKSARDTAIANATRTSEDRAAVAADKLAAQSARNDAEGFAASISPQLLVTKSANLSDLTDRLAARANLGFWVGTVAQYNALPSKDANTIYIQT